MRTITVTVFPEIIYPCPFCSSMFPNKFSVKVHIKNGQCQSELENKKVKFKFLKPR